jgi:multiple sugar transport system permease protein
MARHRTLAEIAPDILLLTPAVVLLLTFVVIPIVSVSFISFSDWPIIGVPEFIGMGNYSRLIGDRVFWLSLRNTLVYALLLVPIGTVLSFAVAILLHMPFRGQSTFKAVFVVPLIAGIVVTSNIWKGLLTTFGPVNEILNQLGINRINFFSVELSIYSVVVSLLWRNFGYYALFFIAGLKSIDGEIYDSASVDGCTGWKAFRFITWPLMRHVTFLVLILSTIGAFQIFAVVHIMTGGGPANASISLLNYIYQNGWRFFRMGYAASMAVVFFFVLLSLSLVQRSIIGREDAR